MKNFYNEFKTQIVTIAIIFVAFFLYTKLAGPIPFFVNSVQTTKTDLFSASGEGEETAVPDTATVSVGITQQATTVADAQNKANTASDKVITAIKKLGVQEKDIKTTNYSVNPNYGSNTKPVQSSGAEVQMYAIPPIQGSEQPIIGYTVNQNLEIKVKDLDNVNKVIDTATASGANLVGGVYFTFSDETQKSLEKKAREKAVKEAKQRAQELANTAGIKLGKVVNVIESGNGAYPFRTDALLKADEQTPTNVTPGENTVTVNVTLYYETY